MKSPNLARNASHHRTNSHRAPKRRRKIAVQFSFYVILVVLLHKCTRISYNIPKAGLMDTVLEEFLLTTSQTAQAQRSRSSFTNSTTLQPVDDSYWLENLDTSKPVACGANKCFFERKDDPKRGYLISPQKFRFEHRTSANDVFNTLRASFELAQNLTFQHRIRHFLQSPPMHVTVSKPLERHLNSNLMSEARNATLTKKRFKKTAFVQQVVKAPSPTLIFGCTASKRGLFFSRVEEFISNLPDKQVFARNFGGSMIALRELLLAETCLFIDFHALIGVNGEIYHLDFDRCFRNSGKKRPKKPSKSCLEFLVKVEKRVQTELNSYGIE